MTLSIVTPWLEHPELIPAYEATVAGAEVVIVDQASTPDVARALDELVARLGSGSRVIHNAENVYFAAANNIGLAVATGDVVVMLNNDVTGGNAWLSRVEKDTPDLALVGPTVQGFDVDGVLEPYVEGWCVAARRSTWNILGGWDAETFPRAYAEDVDLSFRARVAGCRLLQSRWRVQHLGNVTNSQTADGYTFADRQREVARQRIRDFRRQAA